MLIGIPEVLNPEIMRYLMEMGHGDEIVIGDINFPQQLAESGRCAYAKGINNLQMLDAVTKLMPLDIFVDDPVTLMEPGELYKGVPPIWEKYDEILKKNDVCGAYKTFNQMERFAFYERAKKAYAVIATSDPNLYACMILKKGAMGDFGDD